MGDRTFAILQHQELGMSVCYLLSQHLLPGKGQVFPPDQTIPGIPLSWEEILVLLAWLSLCEIKHH